MKIEILCTGDEILTGKTINTNYGFMARRLVERGFSPYRGTTVGDDLEALTQAFQSASERADVVIVNGGLGPTTDDLSHKAAARAAGIELVLHQKWYEHIADWYASRGRDMPANNTKQAMLPRGAEFIDNPVGTACGFAVDIAAARFFFTPGVPPELYRMFDEQILPRLEKIRGYAVTTRIKRFHSFGIGESRADQLLAGIEAMDGQGRVSLGFQSHYPQLEIKLTVHGDHNDDPERILAPLEAEIRRRLGGFLVAEDDDTHEGGVVDMVLQRGLNIRVVESLTGGRITQRLTDAAANLPVTVTAKIVSQSAPAMQDITEPALMRLVDEAQPEDRQILLLCLGEEKRLPNIEQLVGCMGFAISDGEHRITRLAALPGSRKWIRLGTTEMALDMMRKFLTGRDVSEKIDFELHCANPQ